MQTIEVLDSFDLTIEYIRIVAILQCDKRGLRKGTLIEDATIKKRWQVDKRISYLSSKPLLEGEQEEDILLMHTVIRPIEKLIELTEKRKREEENGIFQYKLTPIGHDNKPQKGSFLTIM